MELEVEIFHSSDQLLLQLHEPSFAGAINPLLPSSNPFGGSSSPLEDQVLLFLLFHLQVHQLMD